MVKPFPLQWVKNDRGEEAESEEAWLMRLLIKDSHSFQNSIYHRIFNPTHQ
jgi:hypothetical protein